MSNNPSNNSLSVQRYAAVSNIHTRTEILIDPVYNSDGQVLRVSEYFGQNTLSTKTLIELLDEDTSQKFQDAIKGHHKIDAQTLEAVAHVVKNWALENNVTHFCHWFQPQTGSTAEKHDAFLSLTAAGEAIEKLSGSQLIQSEPDASSFPSGGMRTTFEARGYTAWDSSSPIFIMDAPNGKTLCIPSVFISYHGDALDEKTPLLRSMAVLEKNTRKLLKTLGDGNVERVSSSLGAEQEYFLIDRALYLARPDLVMTGRTLIGSQPPRGQQLEDHYFGSIPDRVLAFMQEVEQELYKLGVPVKTRHNEVAPSQYETAPIFEDANVAADHNQLVMEILRKVATRHNFSVLLHEKPFAGVNGSGKHCNWSVSIQQKVEVDGEEKLVSENLLDPGLTPQKNLRFLVFLSAVLRGVHRHANLMRAAIATPGNDHRLGANEAPPAIISVFLGNQLSEICNKIEAGVALENNSEQAVLNLGVSKILNIARDNTDRNRTSPFAFTGNKFEFRAVGASSPISFPVTVVNTAVAEALDDVNTMLEKRVHAGRRLEDAILEVVREVLIETHAIRFEGNNYSEDWMREADSRGLSNLRKAPDAIQELLSPSSKELFESTKVLTAAELQSRSHVMLERYIKKITIEAETLSMLVDTFVVPAAVREQQSLASALATLLSVNKSMDTTEHVHRLDVVSQSLYDLLRKRKELTAAIAKAANTEDEVHKAIHLSTEVLGLMQQMRVLSDRIEDTVADDLWGLPKYRELLFYQ